MPKAKRKDGFEPFTVEFEFDDPEDTEHVLLGLIIAQSNNSNEFFPGLIEELNTQLMEWRRLKVLRETQAAQGA